MCRKRELNSLSQNLTVLPAPSGREPLARPQTLHFSRKLCRYAKGPILEGAVERSETGGVFTRKSDKKTNISTHLRKQNGKIKKMQNFFDKSITKFNKFSPDFLCILAQHKQAVKFCFLAASFIRSVLPILSSRPAFPAMRSLSYIMVTLLFVMRSAPVPAGIGGTWSPHSYTRESSGGSC